MNISMVPNIWCHLACPGNPHQLCGGNGTLASIYIAGIKISIPIFKGYAIETQIFWLRTLPLYDKMRNQ